MDSGDGTPEIREPVVWVLTQLGINIPKSLSTRRLSTCGNCWLGVRARVSGLLVIPRPSQEVHDKDPHEGLTREEVRESCRLNCLINNISESKGLN